MDSIDLRFADPMTLRDWPGYRMTLRRLKEQTDVLLITFDKEGAGLKSNGLDAHLLPQLEADRLHVASREGSEYQDLPLSEFREVVAPVAEHYKKVFTYGVSLGGYAALHYGGGIDARILAISPTNAAHPLIRRRSTRLLPFAHSSLAANPVATAPPVIFYDPSVADDSEFIEQAILPAYPGLKLFPVRYAGHDFLSGLGDTGGFVRSVKLFIETGVFRGLERTEPSEFTYRQRGVEALESNDSSKAELFFRLSLNKSFQRQTVRYLVRALYLQGKYDALNVLESEVRRKVPNTQSVSWLPFPKGWLEGRPDSGLAAKRQGAAWPSGHWRKNHVTEGGKAIIAKQPGYMLTYHRANKPSNILLIAFDGITGTLREKGFGSQFALKRGYDHVFVAQAKGSQYQSLGLEVFEAVLQPIADEYDTVVTYGNSLGGYCALYYGGTIDATIIAGAPKNSAHPLIRRESLGDLAFTHRELLEAPKSTKQPVVLFDPRRPGDRLIIQETVKPAYPDACYIELPYAGHTVLQTLQYSGVLKPFVTRLIEHGEVLDIELQQEGSPIWHREYGRTLMHRKRFEQAEYHLRASLAIQGHKYTLQFLASVLEQTGKQAELVELGRKAYEEYGKKWYSPHFREIPLNTPPVEEQITAARRSSLSPDL